MSLFKFPFWTPHLPLPGPSPALHDYQHGVCFPETTVCSDFLRKGKNRNEGQGPMWLILPTPQPPAPYHCLSYSATTSLVSFLFLDHGRQVPPHNLCTGCSRCLECSSPRCLHSSPLTSLKPFLKCHLLSGATESTLFNTVTAIMPTPTNLIHFPPTLYFFYLSTGIYHLLPLCLVYLIIMFLID